MRRYGKSISRRFRVPFCKGSIDVSIASAVRGRALPVVRHVLIAGLATALVSAPAGTAHGDSGVDSVPLQGCPALFVLGVQGTGQSSADASMTVDSGLLSAVVQPVLAAARGLVGRAYVPYDAAFGGPVPGGPQPYAVSVSGGLDRLRSMAQTVIGHCPHSDLALLGYSQGAHVVSMLAREIGQGDSVIPADRVAAVALLADPTRSPGTGLFPGASDRTLPTAPPGIAGTELARLQPFTQPRLQGGGIGPERDIAADFGALTGRVASFCLPSDLACDAPANLPILRTIVNIIGQARLNPDDPLSSLSSIAHAVTTAVGKTLIDVADRDTHGHSLGSLSLTLAKPLSQKLAEASDPRIPSDDPEAKHALLTLGTSAVNTVLAITGAVLTPAEVAEVSTAAAGDPLAGLKRLAETIAVAVHRPLPHPVVHHLFTQIFNAIGQLLDDTGQVIDPQIWLRYLNIASQHGAYFRETAIAGGVPAGRFVTDWFAAPGPRSDRTPQTDTSADPAAAPCARRTFRPCQPVRNACAGISSSSGEPGARTDRDLSRDTGPRPHRRMVTDGRLRTPDRQGLRPFGGAAGTGRTRPRRGPSIRMPPQSQETTPQQHPDHRAIRRSATPLAGSARGNWTSTGLNCSQLAHW
ncbi:cutinase family protein [Nocardia terpenica]|uniref:cutinase family protein n=1 Tax=Nocardia terpenica TaxID=455432 RepID=UPI00189569F6|nr:cutinase family protein [Nocardia terpenica]MBF6064945.1 cutinase family protein [Nocardia terpenica]MBF6115217.1 cutinase family protein [Nocardia terpenica]MBF6122539.1 cutinase family protein [Nocardia terpenica]